MKSLQLLRVGIVVGILALAQSAPAQSNPPQMRSRYLTTLTNFEVETYLQRNDIVYVPIGNVQAHGVLPVDCEYVAAEALAVKMAEETDGLVAPYLQFTYPGDGAIGRGTVEVSPTDGLAYLKAIARSLLRQGFKRQIWVTFQEDRVGLDLVRFFGDGHIMWASDYPHPDSTWPCSQQVIADDMAHLDESTKRKIISENARSLYGL